MQIIPFMHIKSPKAIITDKGEGPFRAQRAATAAWLPVGCRLPRPLAAATRLLVGPSKRGAASGRVPSVARTGAPTGPLSPLPRHRPVRDYRRRRCQPPPVVEPPAPRTAHRRPRRQRRRPRSHTVRKVSGSSAPPRGAALPAAPRRPPSPPPPHYEAGASSSSQALYGAETGPSANPPTFSGPHYHVPEEDRSQDYDPGYGARPGGW